MSTLIHSPSLKNNIEYASLSLKDPIWQSKSPTEIIKELEANTTTDHVEILRIYKSMIESQVGKEHINDPLDQEIIQHLKERQRYSITTKKLLDEYHTALLKTAVWVVRSNKRNEIK